MRRGRNQGQASLNKAIDDLLGGDDDDTVIPQSRHGKKSASLGGTKKSGSFSSPKKSLTSSSSSKDFYSSLSAIAGHDIDEDEEEADAEVDPEDAAQVAKRLADMDDLESDLFGSFGSKKTNQKPKGSGSLFSSKQKKKTHDLSDFDEDDPLAGLGLSDEEENVKSKTKKPDLSRKLSQTSAKGKVVPNLGPSKNEEQDSSPIRSSSFDKDDPFLATDPRPRSASGGERMMKRLNSWDEPSAGTQSESELTPRSRSNSGTQLKLGRKGSNKKKVNPSPAVVDSSNIKSQGVSPSPEAVADLPNTEPELKPSRTIDKAQGKQKKKNKKENDDIFSDDDDLPGLSGDETGSPKKKLVAKKIEEDQHSRKATSALDDLLGGKSKASETKSRKPTFLEQMMSSKSGGKGHDSDLPIESESPITSPREKEVKFGGYSPSVGTSRERPTTAPNKRSVRFADELGFDELEFSFSESRPSSAPESGRSKKPAARPRDISAGSSFEDENTDISLDLSTNDFKNVSSGKSKKPNAKAAEQISDSQKKKEEKELHGSKGEEKPLKEKKPSVAKRTSPRGDLQTSRRMKGTLGSRQSSQDDWLGLGEEDAAAPMKEPEAPEYDAPIIRGTEKQKNATLVKQASKDDWLGLTDEGPPVVDNTESRQTVNDGGGPNEKQQNRNPAEVPDDELFPWETPSRSTRQRRRNFEKGRNEGGMKTVNEAAASSSQGNRSLPANEPISHSTPLSDKKGNLERRNIVDTSFQDKRALENRSEQPPSYQQYEDHQQQRLENQTATVQNQNDNAVQFGLQTEQKKLSSNPKLDQQAAVNQPMLPQASSAVPTSGQDMISQIGLQDAVLAQLLSAQGVSPLPGNHLGMQFRGVQQAPPLRQNDASLIAMQLEKLNAEKTLQQHKIEEVEVASSKMEQDRNSLESEIRALQAKINSMEEGKLRNNIDLSKKIEDLESKVRRLENEKEQLINSQELLKKRHDDERKAAETSFKSRTEILEDTYKRRETQIKEENEFIVKQLNERIKAYESEKNELRNANKGRIEMIERNKEADIERIKGLHKKAMEELRSDYEQQIERLRLLKEQEVAAASSMFSQTKSLQSLIQQVHNSTNEMEQLQKRIDFSHKDSLNERENSLRVRDEYMKSMQERLHRQETENIEERSRLQALVARLEMQLREQTRQLEQDRWKITQDENRILSLQAAVEEERKYTMQQLNNERQMMERSREDLMNEQRKILSECYEERRKITVEKAELESIQSKYNKESLEKEYVALKDRESNVVSEEQRLDRERKNLEQSFITISDEKKKLEEFAKQIQNKSKEVEILSKEAAKIQREGIDALEHCHSMELEISNAATTLEARTSYLEQQERALTEERTSFEMVKSQYEANKQTLRCNQCQRSLSGISFENIHLPSVAGRLHDLKLQRPLPNLQHEEEAKISPSPSSSVISSNVTTALANSDNPIEAFTNDPVPRLQTPDILLGGLNFTRTLRKWSADKEQDEEFFEEESKFLNEIQKRREANISMKS